MIEVAKSAGTLTEIPYSVMNLDLESADSCAAKEMQVVVTY
jgi:hypothetical protein